MIGFSTEKVKEEYLKASVVLRLLVEAYQAETGANVLIYRVNSPTRFEQGVHSTGLAVDIMLPHIPEKELNRACVAMNKKFPAPGTSKQVFTLMADPSNLPNGKRLDTPHVHVQIPFDWKADPRAFLKGHGYL